MFRYLAQTYGYTPEQIGRLTMPQVDMLVEKKREVHPDSDTIAKLAEWRKQHEDY